MHLLKIPIFANSKWWQMRSSKIHRIIIAWLLLFIFITPTVAQHIHIAKYACSDSCCTSHQDKGNPSARHDSTNCPVCHFTFSLFTDVEPYKDTPIITTSSQRIFTFYFNKESLSTAESHFNKGPPLSFFLWFSGTVSANSCGYGLAFSLQPITAKASYHFYILNTNEAIIHYSICPVALQPVVCPNTGWYDKDYDFEWSRSAAKYQQAYSDAIAFGRAVGK